MNIAERITKLARSVAFCKDLAFCINTSFSVYTPSLLKILHPCVTPHTIENWHYIDAAQGFDTLLHFCL